MQTYTFANGLDAYEVQEAARFLFGASFGDAWENSGRRFGPGAEIMDSVPDPLPEPFKARAEQITRQWLDQVGHGWGVDVSKVLDAMSEDSDERVDILYYACMGCIGHGVGLWDEWEDVLELAAQTLGVNLDTSPTHLDSMDMDMLAEEYVATL